MQKADFSIAGFDLARRALLGEGIFGRVYDLNDGTVLKLVREKCSGIGSGREKIENEFETLTKLQAADDLRGLIALPLGTGDIPAANPLAGEGFALWLRTTKMPGKQLYSHIINTLPPSEQQAIGTAAGRALARLHAALAMVFPAQLSAGIPYSEISREVSGSRFYLDAIAALTAERTRIPEPVRARPAHNDYNLSNLLFTGFAVTGILDFAERGNEFPEKDLSDVIKNAPVLAGPLVRGYEEDSGFKTDPRRILLGLAENALYGAVISERGGDSKGAAEEQAELRRYLERLDGGAAMVKYNMER
jgi:Phosphotransferase enzyme family